MPTLEFTAPFGDVSKHVVIYQIPCGPTSWSITIDGQKYGDIYERMGGYCYHDNYLNSDDIQAIVDLITEFKDEPYSQAEFYKFKTFDEYWNKFKKL